MTRITCKSEIEMEHVTLSKIGFMRRINYLCNLRLDVSQI